MDGRRMAPSRICGGAKRNEEGVKHQSKFVEITGTRFFILFYFLTEVNGVWISLYKRVVLFNRT